MDVDRIQLLLVKNYVFRFKVFPARNALLCFMSDAIMGKTNFGHSFEVETNKKKYYIGKEYQKAFITVIQKSIKVIMALLFRGMQSF